MKVLIFLLTDTEKLTPLLTEFGEAGINWTIFDSSTMDGDLLMRHDVFDMMFGSLRKLKPDLKSSKTMLTLIENGDDEKAIVASIEKVMGDLNKAGGVVFSFPLDFVKGH